MTSKRDMFGRVVDASFGTCTLCQSRPAADEGGMCQPCRHVRDTDVRKVTAGQVAKATRLIRTSNTMLSWPWQSLAAVTGPLMAGHVNYVVAGTGVGKTTFSLDLVRRWVQRGVGVTVLPLETTSDEWRLSYAAISSGMEHGDAIDLIARAQQGDVNAAVQLQTVERVLLLQGTDSTIYDKLHVVSDGRVDVDTLDRAFALAKAMGHQVVVIDHIDHVGGDDKAGSGDMVRKVNDGVLTLAKHYGIIVVAMSQANKSYLEGGANKLLRFRELALDHVMYSSFKTHNAAQILGIHRPLRPGVTRQEMIDAREGVIEVQEVLEPRRMGINAMKLRHRGRNEGARVHLAYEMGTLRELTVDEQQQATVKRSLQTEQFAHTSILHRVRRRKDGEQKLVN